MRKIISFMHISLDDFVAGPNGEMDWTNKNYEFRPGSYRVMNYESSTFVNIHNS